jgi:ADP-ribose pyrophosphatase
MLRVTAIELVEDRTAVSRCDEGFLRVRRYRARNRREDGSASREYPIDVIERPNLDAVAVVLWARGPAGPEVLLRRGLRPAAYFRKDQRPALPEPVYLLFEELVAGVLEPGERGMADFQKRAAAEVEEEAGLRVPPERFQSLGGGFFMLPGTASEKIHLLAAEIPRGDAPALHPAPAHGDGSPLEEGAELRWRPLAEAIAACERGELEDAKTELGLRRLAGRLAGQDPAAGRDVC